jgi:hypothetical protein
VNAFIEIEQDQDGFHAVVSDLADGDVLFITDSFAGPAAALEAARAWLNRGETVGSKFNERGPTRDDAEDCPRFVCFSAGDSYVEAGDDLEELIAAVVKDGLAEGESAVVWQDWRYVVAVIGPGGKVTRFDLPSPAPAEVCTLR